MNPRDKLSILSEKLDNISLDSLARTRILELLDEDTFVELDAFASTSGEGAGVITGYGLIEGGGVYVFSQDIAINSGAVDRVHAKKIKKVYDMAAMTGLPVIGIYDSNGAKLDDVPQALSSYGDMLAAANKISGVVPQVSLILGTCAGTAAIVACGADVIVMNENAELFLNAPKVVENSGQPRDGAGSAFNAAKSGVAHIIADSEAEAIARTRDVIAFLPQNNLSSIPEIDYDEPEDVEKALKDACNQIETVSFRDLLPLIADIDNIIYLSEYYGENVTVALSSIYGITAMIIGADATLGLDECNKIAYFVNLADSFSIPVITFVNTDGFSNLVKDELAGSIRQASKLAHIYANSTTQKVSIITGKAYGSAYIALAGKGSGADIVLAWPSAIISALYPTTAVAFLAGDRITSEMSREEAEEDYKSTDASPFVYAARGYVDDVINPLDTRHKIVDALDMLSGKRVTELSRKHINIPL